MIDTADTEHPACCCPLLVPWPDYVECLICCNIYIMSRKELVRGTGARELGQGEGQVQLPRFIYAASSYLSPFYNASASSHSFLSLLFLSSWRCSSFTPPDAVARLLSEISLVISQTQHAKCRSCTKNMSCMS